MIQYAYTSIYIPNQKLKAPNETLNYQLVENYMFFFNKEFLIQYNI